MKSTLLCICGGISGYLASEYWYRSYTCYLYLSLCLVSILSCIGCISVTVASIQIHRDTLAAAREGWEDDPYVVSYNIEGVPGSGRCIVGTNVMIAAIIGICMSIMCLYSAIGLVLELEMRDPERGKKQRETMRNGEKRLETVRNGEKR